MHSLRTAAVAACLGVAALTPAAAHDDATNTQPWLTKKVSFRSADGVQLSGSFVTARSGQAIAAVVLGPGGVPGERYENLAALMALRGIATFTYDKRGTGQSAGAPGHAGDISAENLALFASDAAAAMRWLSDHSGVGSVPKGFVAISQSGWVIPLALPQSPKVEFLGFWSGPTCTTSEQLQFQHFSETRGFDRSKMTDDEIKKAMRHVAYRPDDVDPLISLKTVSIPGLWLFGGRDPHVPVELSVQRLQGLIDGGRKNFAYRVYPEEAHDLADSSKQASFVAMIDWIKQIAASLPQEQHAK